MDNNCYRAALVAHRRASSETVGRQSGDCPALNTPLLTIDSHALLSAHGALAGWRASGGGGDCKWLVTATGNSLGRLTCERVGRVGEFCERVSESIFVRTDATPGRVEHPACGSPQERDAERMQCRDAGISASRLASAGDRTQAPIIVRSAGRSQPPTDRSCLDTNSALSTRLACATIVSRPADWQRAEGSWQNLLATYKSSAGGNPAKRRDCGFVRRRRWRQRELFRERASELAQWPAPRRQWVVGAVKLATTCCSKAAFVRGRSRRSADGELSRELSASGRALGAPPTALRSTCARGVGSRIAASRRATRLRCSLARQTELAGSTKLKYCYGIARTLVSIRPHH